MAPPPPPAYSEDTYVNHELSANLDSTYAFEGPEKLLEVWFWPAHNQLPAGGSPEGLRSIPLESWVRLLDLVSCKVLSMKSSRTMDAYLLSESSLFVFPHKMVLKTCGTTTTLACLDELMATVGREYYGGHPVASSDVHKVFYSRRSFMFPDKQVHVHKDWRREVELLNTHFGPGKSYIVGDFASDDHWYLYQGGAGRDAVGGDRSDQTFEILMTQLNPEKAQQWVTQRTPGAASMVNEGNDDESDLGHDVGAATMAASGLASLFGGSATHLPSPLESDEDTEEPEPVVPKSRSMSAASGSAAAAFIHDAFSFSPCGFSSNSISNLGYYYTLHITPESGWSYASFETNYPFGEPFSDDIVAVLSRVLSIFEPRRFSVTLFAEGTEQGSFARLSGCDEAMARHGYAKNEKITYDLRGGYQLLYLNFES
ncbi:S-adenosylmethionine decarboxylase proenzyme [Diutina catenulata]